MADDDEAVRAQGRDAAAESISLAGASRAKADAYLDEQIGLARLQRDNLIEQNAFELSHLRWRRFNDQMKGALQIMAVAVGALIVAGIGVAMWNASQADGLVVDSFSVPPALAATGTTGDAVADDMTDRIAAIRDFANDHSLARSKDVRKDRDQDIKVEIPETGISFAQAWRYLRQWLGNEQHLNGRIRALAGGRIALTVSLGGADTFSFTGAPDDLDKLEQQAAERVFGAVDPVNIVLYLWGKGRNADTMAAAQHLLSLGGDTRMVSEEYSLYANVVRDITGDVRRSVSLSELAISLDPKPAPQHMELLNGSRMLGHDEVVLQQARVIAGLRREDNMGSWRTGDGVPYVWQLGAFYRAMETGDFAGAAAEPCTTGCSLGEGTPRRARAEALGHDFRRALASMAEASAAGETDDTDLAEVHYRIHAALGDWPSAAGDAEQMTAALMAEKEFAEIFRTTYARTRAMPLLAYAQARNGDFAKARATIDATPLDCYNCVRARGQIDSLQRNWRGAQYWFEQAVKQAPSLPFAYGDWGAMLMAGGDPGAAIAKFAIAHEKGPRFADPLELWGEALVLKDRSDLALAKFQEAATYAPNWGRLHLKWGEALWWAGRKDEAKKQFAIASGFDLRPAEKAEAAKWESAHV
jgi:tetratricopeptide (TPR) repeat protein